MIQSLFFCPFILAQPIFFEKPEANQPLEDEQIIVIGVTGDPPSRIELFLNDRLIMARKKPPFQFPIRWDARQENTIRAVASYPKRASVAITRVFREIQADFEESVEALQCFPFLESPPERWVLRAHGKTIQPQTFETAKSFPLNLVILLDISGSMIGSLEAVTPGFRMLTEWLEKQKPTPHLVVFDQEPRLRESGLPTDLAALYKGVARSVIWDAMAAAIELPSQGPRRVILLISDGADDGSQHDSESLGALFKKSGASLIWVNPTKPRNRELSKLAIDSGGFIFAGEPTGFWRALIRRLENQHHLLAPDAAFPIELRVSPGEVWYPRWRD